jgi:TolB-like protein
MRTYCKYSLTAFLLLLTFGAAFAQEKPKVAVLDFAAMNELASAVEIVANTIHAEITPKKGILFIKRKEIRSVMAKHKKTACGEEACALEIGRLLKADKVIWGTIKKTKNIYIVNTHIIDVKSGRSQTLVDQEVSEGDIELAAKIAAMVFIKETPEIKLAEEEKQVAEKENAERPFSVSLGGEANLDSVGGIAFGPYLAADYRYSNSFAFGLKAGVDFGHKVTAVEAAGTARWYFLTMNSFYRTELFAQAELGGVLAFMDYEKTVPVFLGGAAVGARVPIGNWFAEPYIRAGYPFGAGIGALFGMRF